jgi:hypothetical protein
MKAVLADIEVSALYRAEDELKAIMLKYYQIQQMYIRSKMSRLFKGFRGSPPTDNGAVQDLLLRLSAMVEGIPQIAEFGFNTVKSHAWRQRLLDCRRQNHAQAK